MRPSTLTSLAAVLAFGLPGLAAAQPAPPGPPPPGVQQSWDAQHEGGGMVQHLQALHERLGIRPDQERAWQTAIAAMHPPQGPGDHAMMPGHDPGHGMDGMPFPDRLVRMQAMMDRHATMMHEHLSRMIEATRSLYAVLDPAQRRTLDTLPGMMGHMAMMHGGMGGHGMDGHGMPGRMHPPTPPEPPEPPQG